MSRTKRAAALAAALVLSSCAGLAQGIRVAHEATASVSIAGQEVFDRVCGGIAYNCAAEGKTETTCVEFHKCRELFRQFNDLTVAAQSALALAESARARGAGDSADRLYTEAMRFLEAASALVERLSGLGQSTQKQE